MTPLDRAIRAIDKATRHLTEAELDAEIDVIVREVRTRRGFQLRSTAKVTRVDWSVNVHPSRPRHASGMP